MTTPDRHTCEHCGQTFPVASLTQTHIQTVHASASRSVVDSIDNDETPALKHTQPFHSTNK